jgi:hypothetical protein
MGIHNANSWKKENKTTVIGGSPWNTLGGNSENFIRSQTPPPGLRALFRGASEGDGDAPPTCDARGWGPSRGVRRPNTQPDILQLVPTRATASGGTASALLYRIRECAGRR